jgi:hypothetical protein
MKCVKNCATERNGGCNTAVLKCVEELGYRVNWGIENLCIEIFKGTGLQSELGD